MALLLLGAHAGQTAAQSTADAADRGGGGVPAAAQISAQRTTDVLRIDGRLDEAAWSTAAAHRSFTQSEPHTGNAAIHGTAVRVLFDDTHLYVGAFLRDDAGAAGLRSGPLRRDFDEGSSDVFTVALDPFNDSRNVLVFQVNPWGAVRDLQVREGRTENEGWDAVWQARTTVSDSGWTAEIAIPWRTLRYPAEAGAQMTWAVNFTRIMRRDNEVSGWSPWPRGRSPYQMEYAGTLTGLEPPPPRRNARIQPYLLLTDERIGGAAQLTGSDRAKLGGDFKWAITPGTVLDVTVNTDFAQVEADAQVVNLNRYSVFFPEKRSFFLESAGIFEVGYNQFTPFYSRRIGLEGGRPVPLDGGARLTSASGSGQLGALFVRQRAGASTAATHFGVVRASRNLDGGRARLGGMAVVRHEEAPTGGHYNAVFTADGYARLGRTGAITAFVSGSSTTDEDAGVASYLWIRTNAPWGYAGLLQDIASSGYRADAGFIFRRDVMLNSPAANLDLRPSWLPGSVRRLNPRVSSYIYHRLSDREFLQADARLSPVIVEFNGGGDIRATAGRTWQRLDAAEAATFRPLGARIAPGDYGYNVWIADASTDPSRRLTLFGQLSGGGYYNGTLTGAQARVRVTPSPHLSALVSWQLNAARRLGVDRMDVDAHNTTAEVRVAPTPQLQLLALHQWSSLTDQSAVNLRLSWEFLPLSWLHVVYNDTRLLLDPTARAQLGQAGEPAGQFVLKLSYLLGS